MGESLAPYRPARRRWQQPAQSFDVGLGVGDIVLDDLFLGDGDAELDVFHGELDGLLNGALSATQGQGAHAQPTQVEGLEGDLEALALVAKAVGDRHADVVEIEGVAGTPRSPSVFSR